MISKHASPARGRPSSKGIGVPNERPNFAYRVNELFTSIQGEGFYMGVPSVFIRLQGCTVGCTWCDTKYTWKAGGKRMTVPEIMAYGSLAAVQHVVITGGEPTIWDLDPLMDALWREGHYIQLETSGQNMLKGEFKPDWITWSPKRRLDYRCPAALLGYVDEVKWVVDEELRLEHVVGAEYLLNKVRVMGQAPPVICLMPEGCPPRPEMVKKTLEWLSQEPDWRYSDRLQYRIGVK